MKNVNRLALIGLLLIAGPTHQAVGSPTIVSRALQQTNPFAGIWEPAPNQDMEVFIKSLWIDEDGTFAAEMTGGRENLKGTYTVKDGKLRLETEEFRKRGEFIQGVIGSDGRLKLTKSRTDDASALYFVKK